MGIVKRLAMLAVGLITIASMTPAFAQTNGDRMSAERAAAIRECNRDAAKYPNYLYGYLYGDFEIDVYRACMAQPVSENDGSHTAVRDVPGLIDATVNRSRNMNDVKSHQITWLTLMPWIVMLAIAVLSIPAAPSNADAAYCGQVSELSAARLRWTATRQMRVDPAQMERICHAYGKHFYEAVEARQAAAICGHGVHRQRELDVLDAEIDAFNNLIAAQCSGS
jgi:hypothetical protein